MFREWKFIFLTVSLLLLAGCTASIEEKATDGMIAAEEAFSGNSKDSTDEIKGIKLYKPTGFTVSEKSDENNIVFTRNDNTFILFINPNEADDSQLFHDLLLADASKKVIAIETFTEGNTFGFAAVVQSGEENVELLASVGGVKMTTIGKKKNIEDDLSIMMEVVRSVK